MPLFHQDKFQYYRFNISFFPSSGDDALAKFLQPLFDFVVSSSPCSAFEL